MILLTVGTQLPFDRLVRAVDDLAPSLDETIFAQIGKSSVQPRNMGFATEVEPAAFDNMARQCSRIVAHAGIGTVLLARRYGKPIVLLARRARLGEHRTDHQVATANALQGHAGVYIADDLEDLRALLTRPLVPPSPDLPYPGRQAINTLLTDFITRPN